MEGDPLYMIYICIDDMITFIRGCHAYPSVVLHEVDGTSIIHVIDIIKAPYTSFIKQIYNNL